MKLSAVSQANHKAAFTMIAISTLKLRANLIREHNFKYRFYVKVDLFVQKSMSNISCNLVGSTELEVDD